MNTSESVASLAKALSAAQGEFPTVKKDADNPFFQSKYADLASVVQAAAPILAKNGLSIVQLPGWDGERDTLTTRLMHAAGDWIEDTMVLKPIKNGPQAQGSAITYARRYAYSAILGIVTEADDDGNAATHQPKPKAAPTPAQPATVKRAAPVQPSTPIAPPTPGAPAMITPKQLTKLNIQFKELGMVERETRLAETALVIKRNIASAKELTAAEASQVIDLFEQEIEFRKTKGLEIEDDF